MKGIANLFARMQSSGAWQKDSITLSLRRLALEWLSLALESSLHLLTIGRSGESVPARAEVPGIRSTGRAEPVGMAR